MSLNKKPSEIYRSVENQTNRFDNTFKPLILLLTDKMKRFDELFVKQNYSMSVGSGGYVGSIDQMINMINDRFNQVDFQSISLNINWNDLLVSPADNTKVDYTLFIDFSKSNYQLRCDGLDKNFIAKKYSESLSND
jgi:hypothetical protein